jgi:hypothetical protein
MHVEPSSGELRRREAADIVRGVVRAGRRRAGRSSARPPSRAWLAALLLLSLSAPASAREAQPTPLAPLARHAAAQAGAPAATFLIEKIAVVGVRHGSEGIVASETLLVPGRTYSEPQLREALQRVERLPFVVMAEFSLRRGSERGRFELVITVVETKPVFFGGLLGVSWSRSRGSDSWGALASPELGARAFFGLSSELDVTFGGYGILADGVGDVGGGSLEVAYRHHDLFGHHVVGALSAGITGGQSRVLSAELAVPLTRTSVVGLHLARSKSKSDFSFPPGSFTSRHETTHLAELSWRRDTTDDPFAPRRGGRLAASGSGTTGDTGTRSSQDPWQSWWNDDTPTADWTGAARTRSLGGSVTGEHYWPLSSSLALGGAASLIASSSHAEGDQSRDAVPARHTVEDADTWSGSAQVELLGVIDRKKCRLDQCWWSLRTTLRASDGHHSWDPPKSYWDYPAAGPSLHGGLDWGSTTVTVAFQVGLRGRWGTARFELRYDHYLNVRQDLR